MGHHHTPEEQRGTGAVRGFDRGSAAPVAESLEGAKVCAATQAGRSRGHAAPQKSAGVRMALFALNFYKMYLSAFLGGTCRFQPTCSRYAYDAVERFGVLAGSWLALQRLLRCHPFSRKFGYDPVPEPAEIRRHSSTQQEAHS